MPSPKHLCAHPGCAALVNKGFVHCRSHRVITPEHQAKINAALRGRKLTDEHRQKLSAIRSGSGETERTCQFCGKPFTVEKPSAKVRFCSRKCGYAQRQGENAKHYLHDMPHYTCRVCGKEFRTHSKSVVRHTCSYTCKSIWQLTHQKNKSTNIEIATEQALTKRGWVYQSQVALCSITVADFFLPDTNTVIFCDGDYWHSLPGKPEHDAKQTAILQENGYTVHRFLGSEILSDIDACLARVKHP